MRYFLKWIFQQTWQKLWSFRSTHGQMSLKDIQWHIWYCFMKWNFCGGSLEEAYEISKQYLKMDHWHSWKDLLINNLIFSFEETTPDAVAILKMVFELMVDVTMIMTPHIESLLDTMWWSDNMSYWHGDEANCSAIANSLLRGSIIIWLWLTLRGRMLRIEVWVRVSHWRMISCFLLPLSSPKLVSKYRKIRSNIKTVVRYCLDR